MDPDLGSQLLSLLTRAADAALLCLTPVRNDSKTQASISLSCWCSSGGNFPLTGFLQEFQCPGFSGREGGLPPPMGTGWDGGHSLSWVSPAAGSGTYSKGGGFSPGAIAVMSIEVGEERIWLFISGMTELADYNFSTAVTDLR